MRHLTLYATLLSAVFLLTACSTDYYDEEAYEEALRHQQRIDHIDISHDWCLTASYSVHVDAGSVAVGTRRVEIWTANPVSGSGAVVLASQELSDGDVADVPFVAPLSLTTFYAALLDADGRYTIDRFTADRPAVDFSSPLSTRVAVRDNLLGSQVFTYCFEDDYPLSEDYDYNDVVLRISREQVSDRQLLLNVTLAAVGTTDNVAAAMRLVGCNYDDIESVATENNETFNDGYTLAATSMISSDKLLLKGLKGEAVVNLFHDAYWAMGNGAVSETGMIDRILHNVTKTTSYTADLAEPRTITYIVTFRSPEKLKTLMLDRLDPFIIVNYNSVYFELHAVYACRGDQVLNKYELNKNVQALPWGFVIPEGAFRYPVEGQRLGSYTNGAAFGAYMREKHSFGEWASDHTKALDWYRYPTNSMVF